MKKNIILVMLFSLSLFLFPEEDTLTIGMMPAVNSVPLIIADYAGYFEEEGIKVDLVMFKSQMYRESALQTNQIDGTISDMINAVNAIGNGFPVTVTSTSDGIFTLMTKPGSSIRTIGDWKSSDKKIPTGLLSNSIVFYVTEAMLMQNNADPASIDLVTTLILPVRLEMLLSGQLEAACLPEPVASVAKERGAFTIADTNSLPSTPGVILFTSKAVDQKSNTIKAFYRAYNKAVSDLNDGFEEYRTVIVEKGEFPPVIKDSFPLPVYTPARLPTESEVADVVNWMIEKNLIETKIPRSQIVTDNCIP